MKLQRFQKGHIVRAACMNEVHLHLKWVGHYWYHIKLLTLICPRFSSFHHIFVMLPKVHSKLQAWILWSYPKWQTMTRFSIVVPCIQVGLDKVVIFLNLGMWTFLTLCILVDSGQDHHLLLYHNLSHSHHLVLPNLHRRELYLIFEDF